MPVSSPIICVVGARPNFMKMAAILPVLKGGNSPLNTYLVHTGQHYDAAMKDAFFHQLDIPTPNIDLEVGSGTHALQTAEIMRRFEPIIDQERPGAVLVVGDVNSTIACALVAVKKGVPVIHVEAGLRSWDRTMPEEINRILVDQLADFLFTTERIALDNLTREGISANKVHFVGNVMIDTLLRLLPKAPQAKSILAKFSGGAPFPLDSGSYGLLTLHRPSNVDEADMLEGLLQELASISKQIPLIFPIHPRTRAQIKRFGLEKLLAETNFLPMPPIGYLEMLGLMKDARLVLTDSGGIQEETTALGIPCITIRENTERPITITSGTNTLVGSDGKKMRMAVMEVLEGGGKAGRIPELWDGKAALRIAAVLQDSFANVCAR
ncbi:MAG: UDP-N-acetylglucosamine 2-epimerase (non-hydrolyzing) [Magnetococcales bacterium]|nr:UDP-N-acetylglucosamine 2-epimerase (non-hydrolyzing) [Magnetococcales bacterium]